jgi:hypothetical protein
MSSNFSVIFEEIGTLTSSDMPENLEEITSTATEEKTYEGRLEQASSLGLLQLVGNLGGFTLPAGIPDLVLSKLVIQLTTAPEIGVKSFAFTGESSLELGKKFDLLGLTVQPPEGAIFTFELKRTTSSNPENPQDSGNSPPQKITTGMFALSLTMPKQSSLTLSSALAWLRDVPGIDRLRELQNDDESDSSELIGLVLTPDQQLPGDDIQIQLVEKSLGTNRAAEYLSNFDSKNWNLTFEFLGESFEISNDEWFEPNSGNTNGNGNENGNQKKQFTFPFLKSSGKEDLKPASKPAQVQPVTGGTMLSASGPRSADASDNQPDAASDSEDTDDAQSSGSKLSQAISLGVPTVKGPETDDDGTFISIVFPATITVGSLRFNTKLPVKFILGSFAIAIDHSEGIKILSPEPELKPIGSDGEPKDGPFELFGLEWRFFGAEVTETAETETENTENNAETDIEAGIEADEENAGAEIRDETASAAETETDETETDETETDETETDGKEYHHFTLVTKDFNYQIQQAPGARIEVAYTKASRDPIVFIVEDFVISAKGISITATVSDRPAQLNGIDTQYRFHGSQLRIVENEILDFTLSGSGPLPPKLVGDAMADISLQFRQAEGNLKLVAGAAKIQGDKLLDCKGTRFRFSVDSMGLQFVNDDRFHIFFTITGTARFVLQEGDDRKNGALSMLPNIQIDLVDCPLTGDASVIAKHVQFLVELPKPVSFPFLGAYEFELRAIGFLPQFDAFENDVAMQLSGQIKFAQGKGDAANDQPDLHSLYIGLPGPKDFFPRLYMDQLPLDINAGEAFKLNGVVEFKDDETIKGFEGEGVLEIQGMPPMAASFGFYRVRNSEDQPWVRAWFIYLEVRQISFRIPVVEFFIREVGLGFGYRYTLVGIRRADEAASLTELLKELKVLSRTQGDLSKRDRWALDVEDPGQDPRWTIVLRAMIAQLSAAASPLVWNAEREEKLACVYLFDAVIAFRSDLTFFMNVRGWINTSYGMYVKERNEGNELEPLFSGFVFLWPRQKRFLAHLASNPNGHLGSNPPLPDFVQSAIRSAQFSATLLIEPGLTHFELGWPNMLRWSNNIGPLQADIRGGFIFRVSSREMVIGISFLARASLEISTSIDLGLVGASVEAKANAAFGARYIGLVEFDTNRPTLYGAIGLELRIQLFVALWIRIPLLFKTIRLTYRFTLTINFTAGLEFAFNGVKDAGLRGSGTLAISAMGHQLQFNVRLSSNPDAVTQARARTEKYLNLGLEATEVEATLPGVEAASRSRMAFVAEAAETAAAMEVEALEVEAFTRSTAQPSFGTPNYSVFVIRDTPDRISDTPNEEPNEEPNEDTYAYFVLFPRSIRDQEEEQATERYAGFLPVPPNVLADVPVPNNQLRDFQLVFPEALQLPQDTLEWFNPQPIATGEAAGQSIGFRPLNQHAPDWLTLTDTIMSWRANWDQPIFENTEAFAPDNKPLSPESIKLRDYLTHAYITADQAGLPVPVADPDPLATKEEVITDERVQNPSDDAFEAAVRGATEQFRSSPFFKHNPNCLYEQQLEAAFRPDTTIYADQDPDKPQPLNEHQQAHQVRSMVINDLMGDLRKYVDGTEQERSQLTQRSVAFQMGLVFRVPKRVLNTDSALAWLNYNSQTAPTLHQRTQLNSQQPDSDQRWLRTFNVLATDFSKYPPQFQQVRHFTDANTIAIAWDLQQANIPENEKKHLTELQQDPEHNLMYYEVRRRSLNAQTPEVVYQVKGAAVLHEEKTGSQKVLNILKPRFQVVDHFTNESLDDVIRLPATGLSYLYTITPYDFGGNAGHPLILVATRYPNEPPAVPVDSQFTVSYTISDQREEPVDDQSQLPLADLEAHCTVTWTEPTVNGPRVPVDNYYLVFRKETTLPIGSYGLDSSTQRPRNKLLPTSNSRALPTDIKIQLENPGKVEGEPRKRIANVSLDSLRQKGILPAYWQPEAWKLFIQTESVNRVCSALAPVQVLLKFESPTSGEKVEERQPAELEWLPKPLALPLLPPEDQRAIVGNAHVPMPKPGSYQLESNTSSLRYQPHPAGIRCIRFRWNQGPSRVKSYALALTASYDLLELDIDAHTTATFADPDRLADVLRLRQTVQMLSPADLPLTPGDTLSTNQWEAWYPSQVERRALYQPIPGAQIKESSWYSWRESILVWPEWPGLTDGNGNRDTALHPFLEELIQVLQAQTVDDSTTALPKYRVSLQTSPPIQPQTLTTFLNSTAETADPYGWGILQRFGLTTAFTLQDASTGDYITGDDLLKTVQSILTDLKQKYNDIYPHLHVELLFQAAKSIGLEPGAVSSAGMLALIQISLRPTILQIQRYYRLEIKGDSNSQIKLRFELNAPLSLIDQSAPGSGQTDFDLDVNQVANQAVEYTVTVPLNGVVNLLLRTTQPPIVKQIQASGEESIPLDAVPIHSPLTAYFTANPEQLATDFAKPDSEDDQPLNWRRFKRYAESLNSNIKSDISIEIPTEAKALAATLPDIMLWSLRFFNAAAVPTITDNLGKTADGPWLATAYPRVDTPTPTTPDGSGRLTYDHLITDKWAHTYRYYIRPNHRYQMLWESLLTSPALFPTQTNQQREAILDQRKTKPDPKQGGLDVVLDRIQPVAMPVILSSARLDPPALPGQSVPPGRTWEVMIAQHPEQTLIERNQTLARQLQFRQVAFTLLRRFAYTTATGDDWVKRINKLATLGQIKPNPPELELRLNTDGFLSAGLPGKITSPDHLDLKRIPTNDTDLVQLSAEDILQLEADVRSLDLPIRLGNFQQGALVLQWDTLPFFYQHQLLVIAQSDHQVSEINRVIHKDFEYRSPLPTAAMSGQTVLDLALPKNQPFGETLEAGTALTTLRLSIPLKLLWDSLPETVRQQWPSEAPVMDWEESKHLRSPSALPDLEVVYQIAQLFEGNLEVQVETLLEQPEGGPEQYQLRQLGKSFLGSFDAISPPALSTSEKQGSSDYVLNLFLTQVSTVPLMRRYMFSRMGNRLLFDEETQQLKWLGVLSAGDRNALQQVMAQDMAELRLLKRLLEQIGIVPTDQNILEQWYVSRLVRGDANAFDDQPVPLPNIPGLSYANVPFTLLLLDTSEGVNSEEITHFANQCDATLRDVLLALLPGAAPSNSVVRETDFALGAAALLSQSDLPNLPAAKIQVDSQTSQLTWLGSLNPAQAETMQQSLFDAAVARLRTQLQETQASHPYAPPVPMTVPPAPSNSSVITVNSADEWTLQWTGELTAEAIREIHMLVDDERYRAGAIALFRQVLAGQKAYIEQLPRPEMLQSQLQRLQFELIRIDTRIRSIDFGLTNPQLSSPDRERLQTERSQLEAEGNRVRAEENAKRQELQNVIDAQNRLNAALSQFESLPSAGPADDIPAQPVANFPAAPYRKTIVWQVTVPLLQSRLRSANQPTAADWLNRLTIPTDAGNLDWRNLDSLDARDLQTQVQQVLDGDRDSQAVQTFLGAFNGLIDAIDAMPFTFDYRPLQADIPEELRHHLMIRGKLLHASRSLNQEEQTQLLNLFTDRASKNSLQRFFTDLQDKAAIDRLYERWLAQVYVPTELDLTGISEPLQAKLKTVPLPSADEYALIWQGRMSDSDRTTIREWRSGLTDPAQISAVGELLRQVPRENDPNDQSETVILARGSAPDLSASTLEPVRARLRLGSGTILRYHGLMTLAEADELAPKLNHNAVLQQLFNASLTRMQGGELRIMTRRGSAKPSDLVPILPHLLS